VNASTARTTLDAAVEQLAGLAVGQSSGDRDVRGAMAHRQALAKALRQQHVEPITAAAKMELRDVPELEALTKPMAHLSFANLIAAAHSMSNAAKKHEARLKQAGLPDDFIAQLDRATTALAGSDVTHAESRGRRAGATKALKEAATRGRNALRVLHGRVLSVIGTDDDLLGRWNAARRIPRKPGPVSARSNGDVAGSVPPQTVISPSAQEEPKAA